MSRSVPYPNYRRDPVKLSEVLADCFKETENPAILTAWANAQDQIPGQLELWSREQDQQLLDAVNSAQLFCQEVNTEFTSTARPGADWGTWDMPC